MKKILAAWVLSLLASVSQADITTNLWEDFSGFTNANSATDVSATLDTYTRIPGWAGTKVYCSNFAAKVGTSATNGFLATPAINLSGNGGVASVTFRSMFWPGDATKLRVYLDDVQQGADIPLTATMTNYAVDLLGGAAASKIRFTGSVPGKNRFFLDDVVITQGGGGPVQPVLNIQTPAATVLFDVASMVVAGISYNCVGELEWYNYQGGTSGTIPVAPAWTIPGVALVVGTNTVTVSGTNAAGASVQQSVSFIRKPEGYVATPWVAAPTLVLGDRFTANWLSSLGAQGYRLDVATNRSFSTNWGRILMRQDFDAGFGGMFVTNLAGAQVWGGDPIHGIQGSGCAKMSGYLGGINYVNEDWLITPAVNLTAHTNLVLAFWTAASSHAGADLQVLLSTNYTGGDPLAATWTGLAAPLSTGGYIWTQSGEISLDAYIGPSVSVAFKYVCDDTASKIWEVDDVLIKELNGQATIDFVPGYQARPVGNVTGNTVTGLTDGVMYYYRVCATNAFTNSNYSFTTNVLTVADTTPQLAITRAPAYVNHDVTACSLSGWASNLTGRLAWTNSQGGSGSAPALSNWTLNIGGLMPGTNRITLSGSNDLGQLASAQASVVRLAQPVLLPGAVALIRVNNSVDGFSYVALQDIPAGVVLKFTDSSWTSADGPWRTAENTAASNQNLTGISAGTIFDVSGLSGFNAGGDQVFCYLGDFSTNSTAPSAQFVYGINWDDANGWITNGAVSTSTSYLPWTLTNANVAVGVGKQWFYTGPVAGAPAALLASVNNPANWSTGDTGLVSYAGCRPGVDRFDVYSASDVRIMQWSRTVDGWVLGWTGATNACRVQYSTNLLTMPFESEAENIIGGAYTSPATAGSGKMFRIQPQ